MALHRSIKTMGSLSLNYLIDQYAWLTFAYTRSSSTLTLNIPTTGYFNTLPAAQRDQIYLINNMPITKVMVNGASPLPYSYTGRPSTFSYCGISMAATLDIGFVSVSTPVMIDV